VLLVSCLNTLAAQAEVEAVKSSQERAQSWILWCAQTKAVKIRLWLQREQRRGSAQRSVHKEVLFFETRKEQFFRFSLDRLKNRRIGNAFSHNG
jgi:hypothetical protein